MQLRYYLYLSTVTMFFFSINPLCFSQSPFDIEIQAYGMENGLPNNHVYQCFQDHRGLMWMLVSNTLNYFDGKKFHKVLDKELNLHYTNNKICFEDTDGDIWVKTENSGRDTSFILINSITGKIYSPRKKYGNSFPTFVNDAKLGARNTIWLSNTKGELLQYTPGKKSKRIYNVKSNEPLRIIQIDTVRNLVWLALSQLTRTYILIDYNGNEIAKHTIPNSKGEFTDRYGALHYYTMKTFGAIDVTGKIWQKDLATYIDNYVPSQEKDATLPLARDENSGNYWVKHQNGLSFFNLNTGKKYTLTNWGNKGLIMHVYSIYVDRQGVIWLAAVGGLFKLTTKAARFQRLLWQDLNQKKQEAPFPTRSIVKDEAKGILYINGGHNLWAIQQGKVTKVLSSEMDFYGLNIDRQGRIWVGDSKLCLYNPENGTVVRISIESTPIIWSILPQKDRIWLGSSIGLLYYDLQDKQIHAINHSKDAPALYHAVIHAINEDSNGKLWLLTEQGLFHYDPQKGMMARYWTGGKGKYHLPVDNLRQTFIDQDGAWWIASIDGLLQWFPKTGEWHLFNKQQGFPDQNIYAVYPDAYGYLWMSCDRGIIQFQKKSGKSRFFLKKDGITHDEFNRISHFQDKDGTIYFGSLNGVTVFHPRDFKQDFDKQPNISLLVTSVQTFSKRINDLENITPYFQQHQKLTFGSGDLYLILRFALLDYQNTGSGSFEYQIDGLKNTWTACSGDMLQLAELPYGDHILKVRAKLANGLYSSQQLAIPIEVPLPFYWRWWFLLLCSLILIAGIVAFIQYRHPKTTGEQAEPEKEAVIRAESKVKYLQLPDTLTREEQEWLELLEEKVLEQLHNPDFTVNDLAKTVLVSRTLLYNEMGRILGLTPNGFINEIRMLKAMEILKNRTQELTVKKLANNVGFRDEKYFSQKFKQRFGILPSQMQG